jgi:hypothetical protein
MDESIPTEHSDFFINSSSSIGYEKTVEDYLKSLEGVSVHSNEYEK